MLALLYDIHGNLPALEAVLDDARAAGAGRYLLGGDYAVFGGWPEETVARLRDLPDATWIRGNVDRWAADELPDGEPARSGVLACRAALDAATLRQLGDLPASADLGDGTRAWHASPLSDLRSFTPEPSPDEDELLAGVSDRRLVFGHLHVPFERTGNGPTHPITLVAPGSVGMPADGDRRAAYALLHDDGSVERRRVPYDTEASIVRVLEVGEGEPWAQATAQRLDRAGDR
jgi:diadenosine tetraphosphatase ApaH/serine/threonine PP2A family protein phosphatase